MRLALDATSLIGPGTGVASFTRGVLSGLLRRSVEVEAYALSWRGRDALIDAVPRGVSVAGRPMAAGPLLRAWQRSSLPPIEWWTGTVDVVHGTNFVVPPSRRAARVVTVHDLTAVRYPELCTETTLRYPALVRRAAATGAHVHTVSVAMAEDVVGLLGVPVERVHTVHIGFDPVGPGDGGRGRSIAGGDRYVLALGTVEPRKALPTLVEAFDVVAADDPELRLVIAGPDGWGTAALRVAIAGAAASDRVCRVGLVDAATRADLLAGATVLAYPSIYEGFGLPPLEAMSAGVPVVATAAGALPEVLGDAAEIVPVGSVEALAEGLHRVLTDAAHAATLVSKGRRRSEHYSWDACVDGLLKVYAEAGADR